ncbi:MAG: hypothetical protein A2W07_04705 [candidate division Zixibacteria bacterium RBG_16_43_9]|nr:MAG: hypothetical protein A2W07_04705 [candidate division Zixibacteria bacterium RBG_16_43_9]
MKTSTLLNLELIYIEAVLCQELSLRKSEYKSRARVPDSRVLKFGSNGWSVKLQLYLCFLEIIRLVNLKVYTPKSLPNNFTQFRKKWF